MRTRYNPLQIPTDADSSCPIKPAKTKSRRVTRGAATRRAKPVSAEAAAALERATTQASLANYPAIIAGFMAKGIPESEIKPRENVFTFKAWRALGRIVRKGEHGVKIGTMIPVGDPDESVDPDTGGVLAEAPRTRPWTTTVFHISQTEPVLEPLSQPLSQRLSKPVSPPAVVLSKVLPVEFTPPIAPAVVQAPSPRPSWRERYAERNGA